MPSRDTKLKILSKISNNWNKPSNWVSFILIQTDKVLWKFFAYIFSNDGVKVLEKEWDVLFILDSARYDIFKEVNDIPGDLERIKSLGSETGLFLTRNFSDEKFEDIVYLTANPRVDNLLDGKFHDIYSIWKWEWDEEESTVPAKEFRDYFREAMRRYPDKKIICHFLEPHLSVYDTRIEDGKIVDIEGNSTRFTDKTSTRKFLEGKIMKQHPGKSPWVQFSEGQVKKDVIWNLQKSRLERALKEINGLLNYCDGKKCVITSDHGNAFGEKLAVGLPWKVYEHPPNIRISELVEVPWFEIQR